MHSEKLKIVARPSSIVFKRIGELFCIEKGKVGIKAAIPGAFPLITTAEEYLTHNEEHFCGDAVCIPLVSATGHGHASIKRLHHYSGRFALGSILCACLAKNQKEVLARYVYYQLTARKEELLIPLMQGSSNVSLKIQDISNVDIFTPSLAEQQAIVARLDALAEKIQQVEEHLTAAEVKAEQLLGLKFQEAIANASHMAMEEVAPLVRREVLIKYEESYPELGIRSFGKGTFHKPALHGSAIGSKRLFQIEQGDLLFSNVFAWEGAIAIAQPKDHGRFGSHRFITCLPKKHAVTALFLHYYFLSPQGTEKIDDASPGGAGRNRTLGLKKLMAISVPIPPLPVQYMFNKLQTYVAELKAKHAAIRSDLAKLMPAMLERIFNGEEQVATVDSTKNISARPIQPSESLVTIPAGTNQLHYKAAIATYITKQCHGNDFGKVKLAKCYYLLHERLGLHLTTEFQREAAGPWDREQDAFLEYAAQHGWLDLAPEKKLPAKAGKGERTFKAVLKGNNLQNGVKEAVELLGINRTVADALLKEMKKMHWERLELWATALDAAKALHAKGETITPVAIRMFISSVPKWAENKLIKKPQHYTEEAIDNALVALKQWQLI